MRPKKPETTGSTDLFRARLDQIINLKHELAQLAGKIDWGWIDGEIAPLYSDKGRPGIETRFAIGLLLLKYIYRLSDEGACDRWVHDPYFQYFTGEEFFQHEFPHERSDLSHWRKRFGDKLELLLAESLRVAHTSGALRTRDLARVTVDTTVQPKAITFPTDAKLLHAAIKGLNRLALKHGVRLRQSYLRIAKRAAMMAGRYAHAKQFNRHHRELRLLRTRLGRIIRDIRRKIADQTGVEVAFEWPLSRAAQIRSQQQRQRGWKLYSFHAPEVECIGKGKASAPYEFGVKTSIVTTNARAPGGQFVLHTKTLPGNPYDGHTLRAVIEDTQKLIGAALLARFAVIRKKALAQVGESFPIIVIQEAGLDGFWVHRVLEKEGIESHVVDPASIATSRRHRRAKTDRIDGEALLRTLMAYKRGEPRVCAMVKAPTPEEEDRRRLCRERKVLINERILHINRIKGLLFSQGVSGYEPLRRDRRKRLSELRTGDGRPLPDHMKAQVRRELDRLELLIEQIKGVEAERDELFAEAKSATPTPAATLLDIKGIGPEFAAILWTEAFYRNFANRKQVAAYAGLAPTPWQSGSVNREQGVSKAGNPRLRTTLIQLAWLWLRNQPRSALARWFEERVKGNGGRRKKTTIVALARKLLVALWKYATAGVVIEGAIMKAA